MGQPLLGARPFQGQGASRSALQAGSGQGSAAVQRRSRPSRWDSTEPVPRRNHMGPGMSMGADGPSRYNTLASKATLGPVCGFSSSPATIDVTSQLQPFRCSFVASFIQFIHCVRHVFIL